MKYFYLLFVIIFISSCCTHKKCEYLKYPSLKIEFVGINTLNGKVKTIDINTNEEVISNLNSSCYIIEQIENHFDMRNKKFIFYSENRTDTISNIQFDLYELEKKCNTCLLTKDVDKGTTYKNLKYKVNGTQFENSTEITLH